MQNNQVANFYGRRLGRLSPLAKNLLVNLLPHYRLSETDFQNDNFRNLSKMFQKVNLEIGFGNGEFLKQVASFNPENFYLGVEVFQSGVATLLNNLQNNYLDNLKIYPNSIYDILQQLPITYFDNIYVLFPDPWFKKRHHKRRIISNNNLKVFASLLKEDGMLTIASDVEEYIQWSLMHLQQNGWQITSWAYGGHGEKEGSVKDHIQTRYERKALHEGRQITYLMAKKPLKSTTAKLLSK